LAGFVLQGTPPMQSWSQALGVDCTHCHLPRQWVDRFMATFAFALRMQAMVDGLNAGPLKGIGEVRYSVVSIASVGPDPLRHSELAI
jgi:hypothetical protein